MNENTVFEYENIYGKLTFEFGSPFWITDISGISGLDVDITESRGPTQVGSSVAGQSVRPRPIVIDGAIFDPLRANRKKLIDAFAPTVPATLTIKQNGESWYVNVVPEKTPEVTPGNGVQFFQLKLYAAYPYLRTSGSHSAQIVGITALFKFPFYTGGTWWLSRFGETYFSTLTNQGNVPIEFDALFVARGPVKNPELYHVGSKRGIYIKKDMSAGEQIKISTVYGQRGVVFVAPSGEASNGFKYLSPKSDLSMSLIPGDNLLRVDAQEGRENLSVRVDAPEGARSGV